MERSRFRRSLALLFAALAVSAVQAAPDVLERPALQSERAARAVMLAVARAGERVVAVGERGIVLLSDDHGMTWSQAKVPVSVTLTNLHFPTPRQGWAVGHGAVVLHTTDGGETWSKQLDGRQAARMAWEATRVETARMENGEARQRLLAEAERLVADGPDKPFLAVHFFDTHRGLVVGAYGLAFATEDGGGSWRTIQTRLDNPKGKHLYAIYATASEILIAGEQGALLRSDSEGTRFTEVRTPYTGTYFGVVAPAPGQIFVYGLRGNAFWSGDGGRNWKRVDSGGHASLTAGIKLKDGGIALVDEGGRVLTSSDGGLSLKPLKVPQPFPFSGIAQASDGALLLSGARGVTRLASGER